MTTHEQMPIEQLGVADYDDLLTMLHAAFNRTPERPMSRTAPIVYRPLPHNMACTRAVRENGNIIGAATLFPANWQVYDRTLSIGGVGGVGVHPDHQGKGLMSALMMRLVQDAQQEGFDLSLLGGLRQRYRRFGYEKVGALVYAALTTRSSEQPWPEPDSPAAQPDGQADLDAMHALFQAQPIRTCRSRDDFALYLACWQRQTWVHRNTSGQIDAYAVTDAAMGQISELVADGVEPGLKLLAGLLSQTEQPVINVDLPTPWLPLSRAVIQRAENVSVRPSGNWLVLNWQSVLGTLLAAVARHRPLMDGQVVLEITDQNQCLRLSSRDNQVTCEPTNQTADLRLPGCQMMQVVFGPMPIGSLIDLPASAAVLGNWCPLPLAVGHQDRV